MAINAMELLACAVMLSGIVLGGVSCMAGLRQRQEGIR